MGNGLFEVKHAQNEVQRVGQIPFRWKMKHLLIQSLLCPMGQFPISPLLGCIGAPAQVRRFSWWFRIKAAPICPSVPWKPSLRLTGASGWFGNPWNFGCPKDRTQRAHLICRDRRQGKLLGTNLPVPSSTTVVDPMHSLSPLQPGRPFGGGKEAWESPVEFQPCAQRPGAAWPPSARRSPRPPRPRAPGEPRAPAHPGQSPAAPRSPGHGDNTRGSTGTAWHSGDPRAGGSGGGLGREEEKRRE